MSYLMISVLQRIFNIKQLIAMHFYKSGSLAYT